MHPPDDDVTPRVGRHRRPEPFQPRHRMVENTSRRPGPGRPAAILVAVAVAAVTASGSAAERPTDGAAASVALSAEVSPASELLKERAEAAGTTSRSAARAAAAPPPAPTAGEPAATVAQAPPEPPPQAQPRAVEASASPAPAPPPPPPKPAPVGGLTQRQMDHAAAIVAMGQRAGLPERAYIVAIATALQESNLRNLANPAYPESLNRPNDGTGYDHDSVGLFQQRPSTGWGSVSQIMDPAYAATKFYEGLARVSGWESLPITVAAQRVQISAFPDAYAKHEVLARQIVAALT